MRAWRDMAVPPTDAQIAEFKAQGVAGLAGYFKFDRSGRVVVGEAIVGDNIYYGWPDERFEAVQRAGLGTLAFCSGWDAPPWCRDRAARLGIQPWLDDEEGIRPHGPWVPGWLAECGAGQYGNGWVHVGVSAPLGHIYAGYFGYDPRATWPSWVPRPSPGPWGWQWQGTHNENGEGVDSDWYDDAIGGLHGAASGGATTTPQEVRMLYVSRFHPLAATLAVYAPGGTYRDPVAVLPVGQLAKGATVAVDGYVWSSDAVQSTIPVGADHAWWHAKSGQWLPDAIVDTSKLAGAPGMAVPAAEAMSSWFARESELGGGVLTLAAVDAELAAQLAKVPAGVTLAQVDAEVAKAVAALPPSATPEQVKAAIAQALAALPAPAGGVPNLWQVIAATLPK